MSNEDKTLKIQTDNDQNIYGSRTQAYNLQQPDKEPII